MKIMSCKILFCRSLPSGFHAKMSSPVKTMEYMKRGVKVGEKNRRWTATTISCYVALWRRSLSSVGVNESPTCFSSRRVCSGV